MAGTQASGTLKRQRTSWPARWHTSLTVWNVHGKRGSIPKRSCVQRDEKNHKPSHTSQCAFILFAINYLGTSLSRAAKHFFFFSLLRTHIGAKGDRYFCARAAHSLGRDKLSDFHNWKVLSVSQNHASAFIETHLRAYDSGFEDKVFPVVSVTPGFGVVGHYRRTFCPSRSNRHVTRTFCEEWENGDLTASSTTKCLRNNWPTYCIRNAVSHFGKAYLHAKCWSPPANRAFF